jgi:hypothetical protein
VAGAGNAVERAAAPFRPSAWHFVECLQ